MKRSVSISLLFGLFTILSVSCGSVVATTVTTTPESSISWWTLWLTQPACQPPCWQNITPGVTTIGEAVSILENMPKVVITYNGKLGLSWNFGTKTEGGSIAVSEDRTVSSIWLANSSNRSLYLREIVASYGLPKYVKPYDCREGMCETVLIYPDLGMFLNVFIENTGESNDPQMKILPETVVDRVYFIERGMENFQKIPDFQEYDLLVKWKGFGDYP